MEAAIFTTSSLCPHNRIEIRPLIYYYFSKTDATLGINGLILWTRWIDILTAHPTLASSVSVTSGQVFVHLPDLPLASAPFRLCQGGRRAFLWRAAVECRSVVARSLWWEAARLCCHGDAGRRRQLHGEGVLCVCVCVSVLAPLVWLSFCSLDLWCFVSDLYPVESVLFMSTLSVWLSASLSFLGGAVLCPKNSFCTPMTFLFCPGCVCLVWGWSSSCPADPPSDPL